MEKNARAFFDFIQDLALIHERGWWRESFTTFTEYCEAQWHLDRITVYGYIASAKSLGVLESAPETASLPMPTKERQTAAHSTAYPTKQRSKVYREAVAMTDGKTPTGKQVEQARSLIAPRLPRQTLTPVETVAAARASGIIGSRTDVEIHDPSRGVEPDATEEPAAEPEPTGEESARSLPAYPKIAEHLRPRFVADALFYRQVEGPRREFIRVVSRAKSAAKKEAGGVIAAIRGKICIRPRDERPDAMASLRCVRGSRFYPDHRPVCRLQGTRIPRLKLRTRQPHKSASNPWRFTDGRVRRPAGEDVRHHRTCRPVERFSPHSRPATGRRQAPQARRRCRNDAAMATGLIPPMAE